MTDLVPADQIEQIVGARRHPTHHLGRAVSGEQTVYILHSAACKDSGLDLRECPFSIALDRGILVGEWIEDEAVSLVVERGSLIPLDFLPPDVELLDGCDCTELCEMGPTCPGGMLARLPGSGCWRSSENSTSPAVAEGGDR